MNHLARRLIFASVAFGIAIPALADDITKVHPKIGDIPTVKAVQESTLKLKPQIQPYRSSYTREHENPGEDAITDWFKVGPPNDLVLGGLLSESRVVFQPSSKTSGPFWPAISATGWVPPDPSLAVSKTHVVVTVNSSLAFFTKAGTKTFEQRIDGPSGFWGSLGAGSFVFDPKCFFDPLSKRFFLVGLELDDANKVSKYLLAVSSTDNPNGSWNKYRIDNSLTVGSNHYWLDYPGWGFNKDWIVASGNMFAFSGSTGFGGVQAFAFNKANLIAGNTAGSLKFISNDSSLQWAKNVDPNSTACYGVSAGDSSSMTVYALKGSGASAQLVSTSVAVPQWQRPVASSESVGGHLLASLDGRILTSGFSGGHLVASHTSTISPSDSRNASRWYDFKTNGWPTATTLPTLFQSGQVAGAVGEHLFMPAININKFGDLAMTFTRSSAAITADMMVTGRKPSDPLGTMGLPKQIASSVGIYGGVGFNRWGDYFGVEVDPSDSRTFWGVAMTGQSDGSWLTNVNTWKISTASANVPFGIGAVSVFQGTNPSGTAASLTLKDNSFFSLLSITAKQLGEAAAVNVTMTSPVDPTTLDSVDLTIDCTGVTGSTLQVFGTDVTGKSVMLSVQPNNGAATALVHIANVSQYIGTDKKLNLIIRNLKPIRLGGPHNLFQIDRVNATGTLKDLG